MRDAALLGGSGSPASLPTLELIGAGFRYTDEIGLADDGAGAGRTGRDSDGGSAAGSDGGSDADAGGTLALRAVDLRIDAGEMVAVLGAVGSGTSTLCRLASGLLAGQGERAGGRAAGQAEERGVASGVISEPAGGAAMLGDDPEAQLTGMTSYVDDEVQLPARLHGVDAGLAANAAVEAMRTLGIGGLAGRRLDRVSGGERQLVALAGLLTLHPALIVLDQPTLSLDPGARQRLTRGLRAYCASGGAVLVAGHQHDELSAACDRVVFLEHGRTSEPVAGDACGPELLAAHGVWRVAGAPPDAGPASTDVASVSPVGPPVESPVESPLRPQASIPTQIVTAPATEVLGLDVLSVDGLEVHRGERRVLSGVRLTAPAHGVVAVVGPNGAGKSTLLEALIGALPQEARKARAARVSGSVRVRTDDGDVELSGLPVHRRARHLGWVGQDPGTQLSAATVRTELEGASPLPPHRRRDRARLRAERAEAVTGVLALAGLAEAAAEHPYDLGPSERKDLVIASALLMRPEVLLLDEPTLGRDLAGMRRLEALIRGFAEQGGAVILTTHDRWWARGFAHRVLELTGGSLRPAG